MLNRKSFTIDHHLFCTDLLNNRIIYHPRFASLVATTGIVIIDFAVVVIGIVISQVQRNSSAIVL